MNTVIKRVDKNGASVDLATIPSPAGFGSEIAVADGYIYYTDVANARIMKRPTAIVGASVPITTNVSGAAYLIVVGSTLYWTEGVAIKAVSIAGGTAVTKGAGLANPHLLSSDGTYLYTIDLSCLGQCYGSVVRRFNLATFAYSDIISAFGNSALAMDQTAIYLNGGFGYSGGPWTLYKTAR